jgi:hypothetical protein
MMKQRQVRAQLIAVRREPSLPLRIKPVKVSVAEQR